MSSLYIYFDQEVRTLFFEKEIRFRSFQIYINKKKCIIEKGSDRRICNDRGSVSFENYRFIFHLNPEEWYLLDISAIETIGRQASCDLCIPSSHISNIHARIYKVKDEYWVQDCQSRNGLYKNGTQIKNAKMVDMDIFYLADHILYYIHGYILTNQKVKSCPSIPYSNPKNMESLQHVIPPAFTFHKISLESPVLLEPPKKSKLFQAIGPGLLIFLSSGLSILVEKWISSATFSNTRLISPVCMGITFLSYGLINRKSTYKDDLQTFIQQEKLYLSYLKKKEQEMESSLKNQEGFLQEEKFYFHSLKENKLEEMRVLLGNRSSIYSFFQASSISYQHENNSLVQKEKELLEKGNQTILENCFFTPNQRIWIPFDVEVEYLYSIILQILQVKKPMKVVIGMQKVSKENRVFAFSQCIYYDSFLSIDSNEEYLLITDSVSIVQRLNPKSLIYISNQPFTFPYDQKVENIVQVERVEEKLRSLLYCQNQNGKDIESYFQKGEEERVYLDCCVGLDIDQKEIWLNFQEGIDGPHALVAGMTGSGKSEFLSVLLMGLIVRNDPKYFQYILVDFKGGAFGTSFYEYSHCAGMVTNLEEENLSRLMQSLHFEIQKRQLMLQEAKEKEPQMVSHIDAYNRLNKKKISHLFIIVDEFAQMKMKYPEYLENLKEYARIGRSLGIHLILATQKPMGVVDEQIWSNSTLKVCLKVNSEMDSKEMLHNEKGAYLKNAGDFIAQNLERQVEGKAFYLQSSVSQISDWMEVKENTEPAKNPTILATLSKRIPKGNHKWVLLPPLSQSMSYLKNQWAWMDLPSLQQQQRLFLETGQSMIVLCQSKEKNQEFVNTMITIFRDTIRTLGTQNFGNFPKIEEKQARQGEQTWLIVQENLEWLVPYLQYKNLRIIVLVRSCGIKIHSYLSQFHFKCCIHYEELDVVRTFMDQFQIGKAPFLKIDKECHTVLYPRFLEPISIGQYKKEEKIFIGMDNTSQTPVFYSHSSPLLVCFVQQSKEREVIEFVSSVLKEYPHLVLGKDIVVINLLKDIDYFSSGLYSQIQYDINILWIGQGIQEYGYVLKRSIPYERDMDRIFYEGKEIRKLLYGTDTSVCPGIV
ncbi:MAG: FHA domain-containing protein [Firmicutes bacterium]|nr:FHA domain-containing protein [Bacillota bacterium]